MDKYASWLIILLNFEVAQSMNGQSLSSKKIQAEGYMEGKNKEKIREEMLSPQAEHLLKYEGTN